MVAENRDARTSATAPTVKPAKHRTTRAAAASLSEAQLHDIEQLSDIAERKRKTLDEATWHELQGAGGKERERDGKSVAKRYSCVTDGDVAPERE